MTQWGLDNLFNPGKRHMDDEKRRLQSTREEIGDNSGGRRIDLEGGKVSISVRRPTAPTATPEPVEADVALQAEDLPTVALATDDAEIEPAVIDEAESDVDESGVEVARAVATEPETAAHDEPEVATPRRRSLSANAWSRRG